MSGFRPTRSLRVIGVDCAVDPRKVGLALVLFEPGKPPRVDELALGTGWPAIDAQVADWATDRTLIAIDAPLGWPLPLGEALADHRAGQRLLPSAHAMFRRDTDRVVREALGKRPLDVGADRIARTAHAALSFLARLRDALGVALPLAWEPGRVDGVSAIEVYPAGTLASRGLPNAGYKGDNPETNHVRRVLVRALAEDFSFGKGPRAAMLRTDHVLDAALCALAASDFLYGDVIRPKRLRVAKREGWIWVRPRPEAI